jgi:hypothetical protein
MANVIKQKRGTSDPGASDLVVGELAINTTDGGVFTKTDGGSVVEVGAGGASSLDDLSDAVVKFTTTSTSASIGIGENALNSDDSSENENTAVGIGTLEDNTTGPANCAFGRYSLASNTTGFSNIAYGNSSLGNNTTGDQNVAFGTSALGNNNTTHNGSTAIGYRAGRFAASNYVTAVGYESALNATASVVCVGYQAGKTATSATGLTAIGYQAGNSITTGSNLTVIGYDADASSATATNEITLGNSSVATLRCQVQTISSLSDARDKDDVSDLPEGLDFIDSLRPVKFRWNSREGIGRDGTYEAGFIAQDLQSAQSAADADYLGLVMDSNPQRLEASYGKLVPMLVKAIQELKSEVEQLKANA